MKAKLRTLEIKALRAGTGVLAKWDVGEETWRSFSAADLDHRKGEIWRRPLRWLPGCSAFSSFVALMVVFQRKATISSGITIFLLLIPLGFAATVLYGVVDLLMGRDKGPKQFPVEFILGKDGMLWRGKYYDFAEQHLGAVFLATQQIPTLELLFMTKIQDEIMENYRIRVPITVGHEAQAKAGVDWLDQALLRSKWRLQV